MTRLPKQIYLLVGAAILLGVLLRQLDRQTPDTQEAYEEVELMQGIPSIPNLTGWPKAFLSELRRAHAQLQDAERRLEPGALSNLGELYLANGFYGEAAQCFAALVNLTRVEAKWAYYLGLATRDYGDKRVAIDAFERAIRLDDDYLNIRYELGSVYVESGHILDSASHFEFLLSVENWRSWAHFGMARGLVLEERYEEALKHLVQAIEIDSHVRAFYTLYEEIRDSGVSLPDEDKLVSVASAAFEKQPYDPWRQALWRRCFDSVRLIRMALSEADSGNAERARTIVERMETLFGNELPASEESDRLGRMLEGL